MVSRGWPQAVFGIAGHWVPALAAAVGLSLASHADGACVLTRIADLPVTLDGLRATIPAKINGDESVFTVDSGAFYSMMSRAQATEHHLSLFTAPPFFAEVEGFTGGADVSIATVKQFTLGKAVYPNVDFMIGGSETGQDVVGILGQNFLGKLDVEYDLANGAMRVFHPTGCGGSVLAYWDKSQPYSLLDIAPTNELAPFAMVTAIVNGVSMRAILDTGAEVSFLTLEAAKRAGLDPRRGGAVPAGQTGGIGSKSVASWIIPVASFKIGDEEIRNTHLRVADTTAFDRDMLIGMDFFLSHHIYVAKSQGKLYFTYNGGPVFNLTVGRQAQASSSPAAQGAPKAGDTAAEPSDAAGFARRGAAFAARGYFEHAIADLSRACALALAEPGYLYQRALAYIGARQLSLAMDDLNQTLKLDPGDIHALVVRAQLHLSGHDKAHAIADLDAADRVAPKEADVRLEMGSVYEAADDLPAAVAQADLWIRAHPDDGKLAQALNARCWARALEGQELDHALADCNAALGRDPKNADIRDSRGLVRLRLGDLDRSILDYDEALKIHPKSAWSLYGRGLDELRKGDKAAGETDIAAATALSPHLPEEAKAHGIAP
jgi:tetratricopeptide (TPR) repeat protein/predicted aspartyl protease